MTKEVASLIHFKFHRIVTWLEFYLTLPYHLIFHKQEYGWCNGFILCEESCDHCIDMGYNYGMHCEKCYNRICLDMERLTFKEKGQ